MSYKDVVVLGDFNEDLLKLDSFGVCSKCVNETCSVCTLSSCLTKFGLKSIGDATTNFDQTPSLIDLILSNNPEIFTTFSQIDSRLSNHDIVFATIAGPDDSLVCRPLTF